VRVEHYEIAAYGIVIAFAQTLGESDHAALLEETLSEEEETDEKLTELAMQINKLAASGDRIQPAPGEASARKPRNELRNRAQQAFKTDLRPRSRTWAGPLPLL